MFEIAGQRLRVREVRKTFKLRCGPAFEQSAKSKDLINSVCEEMEELDTVSIFSTTASVNLKSVSAGVLASRRRLLRGAGFSALYLTQQKAPVLVKRQLDSGGCSFESSRSFLLLLLGSSKFCPRTVEGCLSV